MAKVEKGKGGKPTDRKGGGKKVVAAPQPVAGESLSESQFRASTQGHLSREGRSIPDERVRVQESDGNASP